MNDTIPNSATAPATNQAGDDPMAMLEDKPDIAELQAELDYAWNQTQDTPGSIVWKENIRYARWEGQAADGLKHRETMGKRAQPYDRAPDSRCFLSDGVINYLVDQAYAAFFDASVKVAPWTAKQLDLAEAAELRAVLNWMLQGPLFGALIDDVEFAAQVMLTVGYAVLHPTWRNQSVVKMVRVTMDQIVQQAAKVSQAPQQRVAGRGATILATLPTLIMDPTTEDGAVEMVRALFPDFSAREARRIVRELRDDKVTEFPMTQKGPNVPELRVLVPGQHYVLPPESTAFPRRGRWMGVRIFFTESSLRQRAAEEKWNEAFVEAALMTKGMTIDNYSVESEMDENLKDIEIFYLFQMRVNEHGAMGLQCTVMSMFVKAITGRETTKREYGRHWIVDYGHDQYPAVLLRAEVTGLRPQDSRGIPEQLVTQQNEMKNLRDALYIYQQLAVTPPLKRRGTAASKLPPEFGPLGQFQDTTGNDWSWFPPPPGNPEVALKLSDLVQKETEDRHGIPRADTAPQRWQLRAKRTVTRWLGAWSEAFWMLLVLAYKNLSKDELAEILGHQPLLDADTVARYKLRLWYDVRAGDGEWLDKLVSHIVQVLQTDTGGVVDHSKLVMLLLRYIDPSLAEEVTTDKAGAANKVFKDVRDEVNNIMLGNKPLLTEKDPTAQMKMAFVKAIMQGNGGYRNTVTKGHPAYNEGVADNLQTYVDNLQHSYQETVLSKQQGRLGVQDVGQGSQG